MTVGPLEIVKDPKSVFPLYELEMRLNELIEIHCGSVAFAEVRNRANKASSEREIISPFAVGSEAAALSGQDPVRPRVIPRQSKPATERRRVGLFRRASCAGLDSDGAARIAVHTALHIDRTV